MGLDSRVIRPVGIPNVVVMAKNVRKLSGKKTKDSPPRGLIPDSQTNQRDLQSGSENDLNRVGLGPALLPGEDKSHGQVSLSAFPSPLVSALQHRARALSPASWWDPARRPEY